MKTGICHIFTTSSSNKAKQQQQLEFSMLSWCFFGLWCTEHRPLFQDLQTGCYALHFHFMQRAASTLLLSPSTRGQNKYYTPGERRPQPHVRLVGSGFPSQRSHQELPAEMTRPRRTSVVRTCEPTSGVKTQVRPTEEFKSTFFGCLGGEQDR